MIFMQRIKYIFIRWWKEFTCDHKNMMKIWTDGEGWNIEACRGCGRARIYTDSQMKHNPHHFKYF